MSVPSIDLGGTRDLDAKIGGGNHIRNRAKLLFFWGVTFPAGSSFKLVYGQTAENSLKALKKEADERLLIEAAQADPARFADLYELNFERVYAYIVRRVQDRVETEDLTAEVFHQALANLKRFEWRGIPFAAWLFRIAANLISDRWQRSGREVSDDSGRIESAQVSPA